MDKRKYERKISGVFFRIIKQEFLNIISFFIFSINQFSEQHTGFLCVFCLSITGIFVHKQSERKSTELLTALHEKALIVMIINK